VSSLVSVVDEFAVGDLGRLEDRQLEDDLVEIDLQMTRLGAQLSRRLAVVDQRGYVPGATFRVGRRRCGWPGPGLCV